MSGLKQIWLISLVFGLWSLVCDSAKAESEMQQAVAILQVALQCPLPPKKECEDDCHWESRILTKQDYTGDAQQLEITRIQTVRMLDQAGNEVKQKEITETYRARYGHLRQRAPNLSSEINLGCVGGNRCVAFTRTDDPPEEDSPATFQDEKEFLTIELCDSEMAENAKAALNVLLKPSVSAGTRTEATRVECVVADPTGTPLNVRHSPNGKLTGDRLRNGTRVRITSTSPDSKGREWAYVAAADGNISLGFVIGEYLACPDGE